MCLNTETSVIKVPDGPLAVWRGCGSGAGGLFRLSHRVRRLFPGGSVPRQAAVELGVPPAPAGGPADVGRHPTEAAGGPSAAGRPQTLLPGAADRCHPEPGGSAAVRGRGRAEEGGPGSAGPAAGAEGPEGARLCGRQSQTQARERDAKSSGL